MKFYKVPDRKETTKKKGSGRKALISRMILTALLAGLIVFVFMQHNNFIALKTYYNGVRLRYVPSADRAARREEIAASPEGVTDAERYAARMISTDTIPMDGNAEVTQQFVASESRIARFNLLFYNLNTYLTTGLVRVYLEDENGEVVRETFLDASQVAHNAITSFSMTGETLGLLDNDTAVMTPDTVTDKKDYYANGFPLTKGAVYTVRVVTENVRNTDGFSLYVMGEKYTDDYNCTLNGELLGTQHLHMAVVYKYFNLKLFAVFVLGILLGVLFVWFPWRRLELAASRQFAPARHLQYLMLCLMFVLTPAVNIWMLAKISGLSLKASIALLFSLRGALNVMIIGLLLWLCYCLLNRMKWAITACSVICLLFGMVNYALMQFRDSPLMATDIYNVRTAMQVTSTYHLSIGKAALWAIVITAVWCSAALALQEKHHPRWRTRIVNLAVAAIWCGVFYHVLFQSSIIRDNHINISSFRPSWNYKTNGYMLSFWVTVGMAHVDKPAGYSREQIETLAEQYPSDAAEAAAGTTPESPNILVVMNESFSDLSMLGEFETNQPYMPYFNSLKENTIRGVAHSSVYGGTTACSEFEFLTGFSMRFLPYHSVPYTNMIKSELPNLTYALKDIGYTGNIALHPGMRTSYNRNNVYPLLGFDEHIAGEDMFHAKKIRAYISDESNYERVEEEFEKHEASADSDQPFYMFDVTIQNHGSYSMRNGQVDGGISISDDSLKFEQAEIYLNLIKKSDEALEDLIAYFSAVDEPTVIIMYGDHQPSIESDFYNTLWSLNGNTDSSFVRAEMKYHIPFIIWANYDIDEQEGIDMSINYMASYLKETLGLPQTGFDKYLNELRQTLPVITDIAVGDAEGGLYDPDSDHPYKEELDVYEKIQYNGLIDTKNRVDSFFTLAES